MYMSNMLLHVTGKGSGTTSEQIMKYQQIPILTINFILRCHILIELTFSTDWQATYIME